MDMSASNTERRTLLHRWPSVLGLAIAIESLVTGPERESVAIVVGVAALCYLGAAAFERPWIAWAGTIAGGSLVAASEVVDRAWLVGGVAVVAIALVAVGLILQVPRPPLTAQTVALAAYGGLAMAALFFTPRLGLALAGVALATHAGWDLIHYRRNQVVPRSLSEFCMALDVPLGVGAILLAIID